MANRKKIAAYTKQLFRDYSGQDEMFDKSYEQELEEKQGQKVECLGMTFENDEERRKYFLEKLRDKFKDPEFRKIEGFPIGSDEDILALSDPPFYTACPNPFIEDFIKLYSKPYDPKTENYRREPFAADIYGSKSTKLYMAHTFHTKVPPESIVPLLEHYTQTGDIILDPFCGSGMTAVAVHMLNNDNKNIPPRKAIISDLSPFATFLADRMVHASGFEKFKDTVAKTFGFLRNKLDWLYRRKDGSEIYYAIWSDVWICPNCGNEENDWELTVDEQTLQTKTPVCAECKKILKRKELTRKKYYFYDQLLGITRQHSKQVISRLTVKIGKSIVLLKPEMLDIELLDKIKIEIAGLDIPIFELPKGFNTQQPISSHNFTHVHDFYTLRNLLYIFNYLSEAKKSVSYKDLLFVLTSVLVKTASKLHSIGFGGSINLAGQAPNTLQIPSSGAERNLFYLMQDKAKDLEVVYQYKKSVNDVFITTEAAQDLRTIPSNSIDYIFTDPPFGANINYSEVSFLYEAWIKLFTNNKLEAIVNKFQDKDVQEYEKLMRDSLSECYRVLKPGRWITVEFHNSFNAIWNAIQSALGEAGFVLSDVRIFDKGQGTWKQMTTSSAVEKDLIISAYKPNGGLEERFKLTAGTEEGIWDFVRTHLKQLPVFVSKDGQAEIIAERQNYLLFDRMVAFHVQRGVTIPLSASEFYAGLVQRFPERDGMYFLSDQVAEYDRKRMTVKEILQIQLFVNDEASAIQWLKQQLTRKPQTFQEIHPQFMRELGGWQKHEKPLELMELLEQNCIRYDGTNDVPNQVHSYLSTNFKELRNLPKDDPALRTKAKDRWYVPDPNKAGDLEKLRERFLLKEFEEYRTSSQKRLKVFRLEAVRAGFKRAWQERDYQTIITVSNKIPENILQEDPKLLMWYDQALTRMGGER